MWPGLTQCIISREVFDHCALVVKNRLIDWGHVPFRMFDVWLKEQGFKELVKKVWTNDVYNGNGL